MLAAFKLGAVPVNVNYRYVAEELRYLFDDAGVVLVVHDAEFTDRIADIRDRLPRLRDHPGRRRRLRGSPRRVVLRSGRSSSAPVTTTTSSTPAARPACPRASCGARRTPSSPASAAATSCGCTAGRSRSRPRSASAIGADSPTFLPVAPLMHGAGQWTVLAWLFTGGRVVLSTAHAHRPRRGLAAGHRAPACCCSPSSATPSPGPWPRSTRPTVITTTSSSLFVIGSGGAPLSLPMRQELQRLFPDVIINDGYGASETGAQAGNAGDGRFAPYDDSTIVLDEETLEPIPPGSGQDRARRPAGPHPARLLQRSGEDGRDVRDGQAACAGCSPATWPPCSTTARSSSSAEGRSASTPGARRCSPRRSRPCCGRTLTCTTRSWSASPTTGGASGSRASSSPAPVAGRRTTSCPRTAASQLAGYKVPKAIVFVDEVLRSPVGKADYRWAKEVASQP